MFNHFKYFFELFLHRVRKEDVRVVYPSTTPSWDSWELDPSFFRAISQWNVNHPESTLDRVLDKIRVGLEDSLDLFELIPDSPFPARSLVRALVHLVKLGITVSRAKAEVQEFSLQVMQWVTDVHLAFESGGGGCFTRRTKKNLTKMRALIDEICKWATARLEDGRWSQLANRMCIAREIDEFKSRISNARAFFMDLSVINVSQGLDAIAQEVRCIRQLQHEQLKSIDDKLTAQMDKMEAQEQAEARRQFLSQMLVTVANPTYNEQGKQPCDGGTRIDILAEIRAWVYDISDNSQCFLWLTGDPGSGKSAIAATVARECKDAEILWAQFFINRNNAETTDPKYYFSSIARQLADHSADSDVTLTIHDTLKKRPSLVDDISADQAFKLFASPINVACQLDLGKPVVVVIDGLDETSRPRLGLTAEVFSTLFANPLRHNAKVLISSRTDDDIRRQFAKTFSIQHVKHMHLDTSAESSIQDVSAYLGKRIAEIVVKNNLNWEEWPGKERMRILCDQASGLFIWAATVVKFFQEQIDVSGRECLNSLLDLLNTKGMGDINGLYHTILQLMYQDQTDDWLFETFRRVVGCIVVLQEPLCIADFGDLLDLRRTSYGERVDVEHFVRRFRTVLVAGTGPVDGRTVPRLHKSFFEFITSERADRRFRVDTGISNGELAMQCLRQLVILFNKHSTVFDKDPSAEAAGLLSVRLQYAFQFWSSHLPQGGTMSGVVTASTPQLHELRQLLSFSSKRYSRPLGLILSPDRTRILSSWDRVIRYLHWTTSQPTDSSTEVYHGELSRDVFSPNTDALRLVPGGSSGAISSRTSKLSRSLEPSSKGHTDWITSTAFFPGVTRFISASLDNTVRIWDLGTVLPIRLSLEGNTRRIISITVSPDARRIAAASANGIVRLWDTASCRLVSPPAESPIDGFTSLAFSPDSARLVLACIDGTTCMWNAIDGTPIDVSSSSDVSLPRNGRVMFFNMKHGWCSNESDDTLLRWLPSVDPNAGLWAYIDGKVMRRNGGGSLTIIDIMQNHRV